ncbi:hypothetical protein Vadar_015988 [Vaccinium darrowii]|uniref:Uncharacterized protein n=1 Tax=Vaccinium darrowii TaxID=229202 RepID=A0ACB7XQZ1_9ERIC|nr:hypothetical protein Vadar_015988 [Vaccinium darrowii]
MDDFQVFYQEDSFNLEETHGVQIESQYSTVSPETQNSRVRGKAFSIEEDEDEALCRAWLAISQDPITGNSQSMGVFWERIRIKEAHRMYHVFQKRPFTFDTSWEILRHSCKWNAIRTQQNNPNSQTSCSTPTAPTLCEFDVDVDQQTSPEMLKRPTGSKGEKEKKKMKAINYDKYNEIAANQTKIVEALTTISSRGIERDQEKAIDRQKRNEAREAQLQYLAMMNERE